MGDFDQLIGGAVVADHLAVGRDEMGLGAYVRIGLVWISRVLAVVILVWLLALVLVLWLLRIMLIRGRWLGVAWFWCCKV